MQNYSTHPTILKIRQIFDNSKTAEQFQFNSATTSEIYKLSKKISDKKLTEADKMSPGLVKYLLKFFFSHWTMV